LNHGFHVHDKSMGCIKHSLPTFELIVLWVFFCCCYFCHVFFVLFFEFCITPITLLLLFSLATQLRYYYFSLLLHLSCNYYSYISTKSIRPHLFYVLCPFGFWRLLFLDLCVTMCLWVFKWFPKNGRYDVFPIDPIWLREAFKEFLDFFII
jgi:hypothetical protein